MEWIVRNRDNSDNPIVYVATLGDMKDDGNCDVKQVINPEEVDDVTGTGEIMSEWQILDYGYQKLDNAVPRIPYGVVPGNHDYFLGGTSCFLGDPNADRTDLLNSSPDPSPAQPFANSFNELFGPARFSIQPNGVSRSWSCPLGCYTVSAPETS